MSERKKYIMNTKIEHIYGHDSDEKAKKIFEENHETYRKEYLENLILQVNKLYENF